MKLMINNKTDNKEHAEFMLKNLYDYEQSTGNTTQDKLPENSGKQVCSKCGTAVDQKVVNYCKHQFQGRTLCRECQEKES